MEKKLRHVQYEWVKNTEPPAVQKLDDLFQQVSEHFRHSHFKEVEQICHQILDSDSGNAKIYRTLGLALQKQGKIEEAITSYKRAISINPEFADVYNDIGIILQAQGKLKEAIDSYKKTIAIDTNYVEAYNNLGAVLQELGDIEDAIVFFKKAILIKPNYSKAIKNLGILELSVLNFKLGWMHYRYRYDLNNMDRMKIMSYFPETAKPFYNKEDLGNKRLYVWTEQGYGDMIMFSRFLNIFADKAASVIFFTRKPLERLFRLNFKRIEVVTDPYKGEYDYHMPLIDAGYVLDLNDTNIPHKQGYLVSDTSTKEQYREEYFADNLFKIGIIWKGHPTHGNDKNRSIRLDLFLKMVKQNSSYKFYSIQKDLTDEEKELLIENGIEDIGSTFNNFSDTAAAIDNLALIISVDTATAHLSAALGKNTWILLPKIDVDWRWGRTDNKSYWYDSVTLFRQEKPGDWITVFQDINFALKKLVDKQRAS